MKRRINQIKAGAILSYAQMALSSIISLVYTPVLLRLLGQSEYGLYSLAASVISYLGLLNFGFSSSYIRYFSIYKADKNEKAIAKLNGLFMIVFSVIGLAALAGGIVLSMNVRVIFSDGLTDLQLQRAGILMLIMSLNMAVSFPVSVFSSYITSNEKFVFQKLLNMIKTVISPLVMLPVLIIGYKSVGMVIVTTLIGFTADVINISFCFNKLKIRFIFRKPDFKLLREIAGFSVFIALNSLIDQINWSVDKMLLGRFRGAAATAVYGVASQLNNMYISVSTSVSNVFTPRVYRLVAAQTKEKEITQLFTRVGRLQFIILSFVCIGLCFFGKTFIVLWAGDNYIDAYYIALLLIIPVTVPLIQNLGVEIQRAYNKHQIRSYVYLIIALINVTASIPLCKAYGAIGCAAATAFSLLIGNGLIMNIFYHCVLRINIIYFWKQILSVVPSLTIPALIGAGWCLMIKDNQIELYLAGIVSYCAVFCLSVWSFGMNSYEKQLIKKPVKRIKERLVSKK